MSDITVGALAARTGLTVRTLHHYDTIGLLSPSGRSEAGYRLYSDDDVRRLRSIVLLRGVGLPLTDIAVALENSTEDLLPLLERHAGKMKGEVDEALRLMERIEHMTDRLRTHAHESVDDALDTIQIVNVFERYFDRD